MRREIRLEELPRIAARELAGEETSDFADRLYSGDITRTGSPLLTRRDQPFARSAEGREGGAVIILRPALDRREFHGRLLERLGRGRFGAGELPLPQIGRDHDYGRQRETEKKHTLIPPRLRFSIHRTGRDELPVRIAGG